MSTTTLEPRWTAVLAGLSRGWIETRQNFTETAGVTLHVFPPLMAVVVMLTIGRIILPDSHFSLATMMLPNFLCMAIVTGGLCTPAGGITTDREDGTLLRAKATPNGMLGYLVGKIVTCALTTLLGLTLTFVPGILIATSTTLDVRMWVLLTLTFVVGMVSTVPIGVALGSLLKSSAQIPLVVFPTTVIGIVSIFFPMNILPTWLQTLVKAFPAYWIGLGGRSAMLPPEMVGEEIGKWSVSADIGTGNAIEMLAVPAVWAAAGLLLAPILLRRMARRQSGSALARMRLRPMSKER